MSKIVPIMDSLPPKKPIDEKKPRKNNKSKTQPQVHFVVDQIKTSPPKLLKSLKLNAIDFTNKKLEKDISQIEKKINKKLNIEKSDNENIINNKKLETIELKQQLDNLNEIKQDINVSIVI